MFKSEVAKLAYNSLNNKMSNAFRKYFCNTNDHSSRATR